MTFKPIGKWAPVPKEEIERFRKSVRERVVGPLMKRRHENAQRAEDARRRVIL